MTAKPASASAALVVTLSLIVARSTGPILHRIFGIVGLLAIAVWSSRSVGD